MKYTHSIVELLSQIEKRPALYISKNYLSCLKAFLDGWCFQNNTINDFHILSEFQTWIQNKYQITSSQSFADIILFYSTDEHEALENFFSLFNDFLASQKNLPN